MLDVWSFADVVIDGNIKIQAGEIARYVPNGVQLKDGSQLDVDVVIFAYVLS